MNEINYLNFYSKSDLEHFSEEFEQKRLSNDKMILYGEFRDSVLSYKNFNKVNTLEILEKLRKDLRDRQHIIVDLDTPISEREYYYQINEILREHNRLKNENDPEIMHLFEIVSNGEPALSRSKIISVIRMFDLPINIEEFFYPIGKKETLNFSEFCLLFKSNDRKDNVFLRSFTKGMKSGEKHNSSALNEKGSNFPIAVIKLK